MLVCLLVFCVGQETQAWRGAGAGGERRAAGCRTPPCLRAASMPLQPSASAHALLHPPPCTAPLPAQAIMLDIVVMLFHILRAYLPAELKWSAIGHVSPWPALMAPATPAHSSGQHVFTPAALPRRVPWIAGMALTLSTSPPALLALKIAAAGVRHVWLDVLHGHRGLRHLLDHPVRPPEGRMHAHGHACHSAAPHPAAASAGWVRDVGCGTGPP